jgi:DDE superfamily endonuclease
MDLCHLDEAGFAPTLPTSYSWSRVGTRLTVPYEAPQGRRVNVIGAYFTHGPQAGRLETTQYVRLPKLLGKPNATRLAEQAAAHGFSEEAVGPIDSERFIAFVWRLAGRPDAAPRGWMRERPLVIVLDNYSVHKSAAVKAARREWAAAGVLLWYLPAYSPELSQIEAIWQRIKYRRMRRRSHKQLIDLWEAVEAALAAEAAALRDAHVETVHSLCLAA